MTNDTEPNQCDGCQLFEKMGVHSFTCPIRNEIIEVSTGYLDEVTRMKYFPNLSPMKSSVTELIEDMKKDIEEHGDMHGEMCACNTEDPDACDCEEMSFWGSQIEKYMNVVNKWWIDRAEAHRKYCTPEGNKILTRMMGKTNRAIPTPTSDADFLPEAAKTSNSDAEEREAWNKYSDMATDQDDGRIIGFTYIEVADYWLARKKVWEEAACEKLKKEMVDRLEKKKRSRHKNCQDVMCEFCGLVETLNDTLDDAISVVNETPNE